MGCFRIGPDSDLFVLAFADESDGLLTVDDLFSDFFNLPVFDLLDDLLEEFDVILRAS